MKLDLLNRAFTAAALVALAVTLGVWLTRSPLTAAPAAAPVKIAPEPTLAPPPPAHGDADHHRGAGRSGDRRCGRAAGRKPAEAKPESKPPISPAAGACFAAVR